VALADRKLRVHQDVDVHGDLPADVAGADGVVIADAAGVGDGPPDGVESPGAGGAVDQLGGAVAEDPHGDDQQEGPQDQGREVVDEGPPWPADGDDRKPPGGRDRAERVAAVVPGVGDQGGVPRSASTGTATP
jgi:hypothetical protein